MSDTPPAAAVTTLAWKADASGSIYWYSDQWYQYTGTTEEQVKGWGWHISHHPKTLGDVLARWTVCLATGRPFQMVFPLRGSDGVYRPFLTRVAPTFKDGNVTGWIGANIEVSDMLHGDLTDEWAALERKMDQ